MYAIISVHSFMMILLCALNCKNVLYDLANGGGKSVLLLLLLQNLIPNCTLDDKQPVEKLFRGEGGSTVIHSLIEWKLDDYLVKDDYRYMLTGSAPERQKMMKIKMQQIIFVAQERLSIPAAITVSPAFTDTSIGTLR